MTLKFILGLSILLSLPLQPATAKNITPAEQQITQYISTQTPAQIAFIEQLVNINSGTTNTEGVYQVGKIVQDEFNKIGFKTRWIEEPSSMHRAGTLIAEHQGTKGKRLLLIGHLDTVFPKNSPFQHFKRTETTATGPGVIDDKGGIAVILYALKALQASGALESTQITVVLTGDEEDSGKPTSISRKPLFDAAMHSDIALDFEWAFTQDTATIARRGITSWTIETQGNEAHSSEIFQANAGFGAIFELSRILDSMRIKLASEPNLSFNPGLILGGTHLNEKQGIATGKNNVIAKAALSKGDLRYLSAEQKEKAEKEIISIINQHLPKTTAQINFQDGIPSMPPTKSNLKLLQGYSKISTLLGYGTVKPLDPGLRGAGDISHIASLVSGSLAGLGAVGNNAHSVNETLDLRSLPIQTERTALFIYQLTND